MSPLATVLLNLLRWGVRAIAAFLALVLLLEAWKHGFDVRALDGGFIAVVGLLILGSLWLARAIGRELAKHGS